jgi:anti-anti-sigma factor
MKKELLELIEQKQFTKIVLNFEKVKYLDSSGLAMFINIKNILTGKAELRMCSMQGNVRQAIEATHLFDFLAVDNTQEDSIENLLR